MKLAISVSLILSIVRCQIAQFESQILNIFASIVKQANKDGWYQNSGTSLYQVKLVGGSAIEQESACPQKSTGSTMINSNAIYLANYCGHGSIFFWDYDSQKVLEYAPGQSAYGIWIKYNPSVPVYSQGSIKPALNCTATFPDGAFTPGSTCASQAVGSIYHLSQTPFSIANWQGEQTYFIQNGELPYCYDMFQKGYYDVVYQWCKISM